MMRRIHLPTSIRVTGEIGDAELRRLETALLGAVRRAADRVIGGASERHDGVTPAPHEVPDAAVHEPFAPARARPDRDGYAVPSYDRDGAEVELDLLRTGAAGAGGTPGVGPVPTSAMRSGPQSFEESWREFEAHRFGGREDEALALGAPLIARMDYAQVIAHGRDLALWLIQRDQLELASRALQRVETAWWTRWTTDGGPGEAQRARERFIAIGPERLVAEAERLSEAGEHELAGELFGLAILDIQSGLLQRSEARSRALADLERMPEEAVGGFAAFRMWHYVETGSAVELARRIVAHHARLEREAWEAGEEGRASTIAAHGAAFRRRLLERYLVAGSGDASRMITLEATGRTDRRLGRGYILHGRRGREEFVRPLPGEPRPDELGRHPFYSAGMEELLETIGAQEDFLTELFRHPEIRARWGAAAIDLNDLATRLRIWRILYAVYTAHPVSGCGTPLCSLLRTIERYLGAFTTHTGYDIRDFGRTYLESDFPEDLLGRVVRDCGVYALTVAYEVYRTARETTPPLPVSFQLYHTVEHVVLVITDGGDGTHYVVNNDRIEGPLHGEPAGSVALSYGGLMQREHVFSVGGRSELLGTGLADAAFRQGLWRSYRSGARLTLAAEPSAGPDDRRSEAQRVEDAHRRYYESIARFDAGAAEIHARMDRIAERLSATQPAEHRDLLEELIGEPVRIGTAMARIFTEYALDPGRVGLRPGPNLPVERIALINSGPTSGSHPLVRLGKLLLYLERLRHATSPPASLSADQELFLRWVRGVPIPSFPAELADYDRGGRPPRF
jgi:hypothetical protein